MNTEQRLQVYTRCLEIKTVDGYYRLTPKQRRRVQKKYWRDLLAGALEEDYDPCPCCGGPYDHSEAACQGVYEDNWS